MNSGTPRRVSGGLAIALSMALALSPVSGIAAEPAGAEAAVGGLSIATDPVGAAVYVDGQYAGQTPLTVAKVTSGDHRVRVVKDGFLDNARVVNVTAGEPKALSIQMTRDTNARRASNQISGGSGGSGGGAMSMLTNPYVLAGIGGGAVAAILLLRDGNKAPVPGTFSVSPNGNGMANQTTFTFTATGASDPDNDSLTYEWDFGDNSTGTGQTATHRYATAGTYTVKLKVKDSKLSADAPTASVVVVSNASGTWNGGRDPVFDCNISLSLTQNGTAISGTMAWVTPCFGSVPLTGTVSNTLTHPTTMQWQTDTYDFTSEGITYGGLNMRFTGMTNAAGSSVNGTMTLSQPAQGISIPGPSTYTK